MRKAVSDGRMGADTGANAELGSGSDAGATLLPDAEGLLLAAYQCTSYPLDRSTDSPLTPFSLTLATISCGGEAESAITEGIGPAAAIPAGGRSG